MSGAIVEAPARPQFETDCQIERPEELRRPVAEVVGHAVVGAADDGGHARALEHHALAGEGRVVGARVAVRHGVQVARARRQLADGGGRERRRPDAGGRRAHVVVDDRGRRALAAQVEAADAAVRRAADLERQPRRLDVDEHRRVGRGLADRRGGHGGAGRDGHGEQRGEGEAEERTQAGHNRMIAHGPAASPRLTRSVHVSVPRRSPREISDQTSSASRSRQIAAICSCAAARSSSSLTGTKRDSAPSRGTWT